MDSNPGSALEPASLCQRIRDGDGAAETELCQHFQRRVRVFLEGRTRDRALIEDVLQEVLIALVCSLREGRLRNAETLPSYVYGIARNQLSDHIRRRARSKENPLPDHFEIAGPPVDHEELQQYRAAEREISNLDPADRAILSMTLVDGMKPGKIAEAVNLSGDAVRQRKSRALKRLAEKLKFGSQPSLLKRLNIGKP